MTRTGRMASSPTASTIAWSKSSRTRLRSESCSSRSCELLYEYGSKRVNLKYKTWEEHSLEEFRGILGVPPGKLERFSNLNQKAIWPALEEVNALAEFLLSVEPGKSGRAITHLVVAWEKKKWHAGRDSTRSLRSLSRIRVCAVHVDLLRLDVR
jgi:plasmid replication initiation protein